MSSYYEVALQCQSELFNTLQSIGYAPSYCRRVLRHVDPTDENAFELCFEWIERHPPKERHLSQSSTGLPSTLPGEEGEGEGEGEGKDEVAVEKLVEYLKEMGFSEETARRGLDATGNDLNGATQWILSQALAEEEHAAEEEAHTNATGVPEDAEESVLESEDLAKVNELTLTLSRALDINALQEAVKEEEKREAAAKAVKPSVVSIILGSDSKPSPLRIGDNIIPPYLAPGAAGDDESAGDKRMRLRRSAITELITSERRYVAHLETLEDVYYTPLLQEGRKAQPPWLTDSEIARLFSNVSQIIQLNKQFLRDLEMHVVGGVEKFNSVKKQKAFVRERMNQAQIGELLLSFAPFFKIYIDYVNNYATANEFLMYLTQPGRNKKVWRRYNDFLEFLKRAAADQRCGGNNLSSLLIMPVQRVPRYLLLIQQFLNACDPSSKEHSYLVLAQEKMRHTATAINSAVRQQAETAQLLSIQEQFAGNVAFVSPTGRKFIRKAPLKVVQSTSSSAFGRSRSQSNANAIRSQWLFLFSDMLVIADRSLGAGGYKFNLRQLLPMDQNFQVQSLDEPTATHARGDSALPKMTKELKEAVQSASDILVGRSSGDRQSDALAHSFTLSSKQASAICIADSDQEKKQWMDDIETALSQNRSGLERNSSTRGRSLSSIGDEKSLANTVFTQSKTKVCPCCGKVIPLLSRRQCQSCKDIIHNDCSKARLMLPGSRKLVAQRVCDNCTSSVARSSEVQLGATATLNMPLF